MKIYENPWVKKPTYFIKTHSIRAKYGEASASAGYELKFDGNKWKMNDMQYYNYTLKDMPLIADDRISLKKAIYEFTKDFCVAAIQENIRKSIKNPFDDGVEQRRQEKEEKE